MSFPLIPDSLFSSAYALRGEDLARAGIRLLLADLDNTLARYGAQEPGPELYAWRDELQRSGVTLFLLSNSRKPTRPTKFARALDIPFIGHAGKPKRKSFLRAMEQMGATPRETAIVGDQIFTDVWGGRRAGVRTILVRPLALDSVFRVLRYGIETPFRRGAGKKEIL